MPISLVKSTQGGYFKHFRSCRIDGRLQRCWAGRSSPCPRHQPWHCSSSLSHILTTSFNYHYTLKRATYNSGLDLPLPFILIMIHTSDPRLIRLEMNKSVVCFRLKSFIVCYFDIFSDFFSLFPQLNNFCVIIKKSVSAEDVLSDEQDIQI